MKRKLLAVLTAAVLVMGMGLQAMAAGGSGNGGGTDGGNQLKLESSSISDGQKDIALDAKIDLVFSNNVVNLSVAKSNATCFTLTDDTGAAVQFVTVMADDQLEKEKKEQIAIEVAGGLKAGKTYTLTISKELQAKNESTLGKDVQITFSTVSTQAQPAAVSGDTDNPSTGRVSNGIVAVGILLLAASFVVRKVGRRF